MAERYGLAQAASTRCEDAATIGKRDMVHNSATPKIEVDAADLRGARRRRAADLRAGDRLPMAQRYFLF